MTEEKKGMRKGCIVAIIIASVILIAVIVLSLLCIKNPEVLIKMGLKPIAAEIKDNLPEGVTAEDVDRQFDDFIQAFKDKKISDVELQEILNMAKDMLDDKEFDQEESEKFLEEMKRAIEE